jgi:thiamin-phosphate kinase
MIKNVLSIAGSDPSGGAGIQADLKTLAALGVYGMAAITVLTAQNTKGVSGVHSVPPEFLNQQLRSIFDDIHVDAVKIGMIGSAASVRVIAEIIKEYAPAHVVLDPVMIATSGDALIDDSTMVTMMEQLCPLASIVTPNTPEYAALGDIAYNALLLKGGHNPQGGVITDTLIVGDVSYDFRKPLIDGGEFHGTGCTLSSALAAYLAMGLDMPAAVKAAQNYVHEGIAAHRDLNVGGGVKPLKHNVSVRALSAQNTRSEFDVIERYFAPLSRDGLKNDAAVFDVPDGAELVVTTDTLNTGVHVPKNAPADLFAQKALRANLSDLAAMGAKPLAYQLALSLPHTMEPEWYERFVEGLKAVQEEFDITLSGGDTTTHFGDQISVSITAFGVVQKGLALSRSGAQEGDVIVVSGTIGDAALGLDVLRGAQYQESDYFVDRYYKPEPRIALGQAATGLARAAIDISDGIFADISHIAKHSNLCAEINLESIPISPQMVTINKSRLGFISKGDDYELAMAVAPEQLEELKIKASNLDIPIKVIGRFHDGQGLKVLDNEGGEINIIDHGWTHF